MNEKKEIISLVLGNGVIFPKIINEDEGVRIVFLILANVMKLVKHLEKKQNLRLYQITSTAFILRT